MNRLTLGAAAIAAVALTTSAGAADLPMRGPVYKGPPPVVTVPSWTACYVGGHAGYTWSKWTDNDLPGYGSSIPQNYAGLLPVGTFATVYGYDGGYKSGGFSGGGQFGCDYQYGGFVLGAVLDFSWSDQKKDSGPFQIIPHNPAAPPAGANVSPPEVGNVHLKYYGTARARLGFLATPSLLLYGTGGLAWSRANMSVSGSAGQFNVFTPFSVSGDAYSLGWAAGVGADWMFARNWTVGIEYLHLDFGNTNFRFSGTPYPNLTTAVTLGAGTNVSLVSDTVRLTLNYRFGGGPVARY